eukprot:jgi/Tetstr1/428139/TSEL_018191.t1
MATKATPFSAVGITPPQPHDYPIAAVVMDHEIQDEPAPVAPALSCWEAEMARTPGLGRGELLELEATVRDATSAAWDYYDDATKRTPDAEVHRPAPGISLLELLEMKFISNTWPKATFARVELASAHAAPALAAYLEDALLCIPGRQEGERMLIADACLYPEAYPHSFDLRPTGANGETAIVVGVDADTLRDTRKFVVAFQSHIAVILAVQTRRIRIHLERDPDHPECLRVRNVPTIEPEERAQRALIHNRSHANNVGPQLRNMHDRGDRQRERHERRDDDRPSRAATAAAGSNGDNMDEDLQRLDENLPAASLPEAGAIPVLPMKDEGTTS